MLLRLSTYFDNIGEIYRYVTGAERTIKAESVPSNQAINR